MKRTWIILPLLFLAFGLFLPQTAKAHPERFSTDPAAADVIAAVNALRISNGLAPYKINSTLMAIAQNQADYMASISTVTHYGPDGARPFQRAIKAGYSVTGDLSSGGLFAENIQSGLNLSATEVVKIWQADADHLNAMISPDLVDVGVGVSVAGNTTYYVMDAGASAAVVAVGTDMVQGDATLVQSTSATSGTPTLEVPIVVNTPLENGTVYHIVQPNEALWSIALAYNVTIQELKINNSLQSNDIYVGQKLLIRKIVTDTPTLIPSVTVTSGIPTSTATHPVTPTSTPTATPVPTPPASRQASGIIVGGILAAALLAAGLVAWLGRRGPSQPVE